MRQWRRVAEKPLLVLDPCQNQPSLLDLESLGENPIVILIYIISDTKMEDIKLFRHKVKKKMNAHENH